LYSNKLSAVRRLPETGSVRVTGSHPGTGNKER
jgi:hypothetical protein